MDFRLISEGQNRVKSTVIPAQSPVSGAKGELAWNFLVDHAVTLRARFTPDVTVRDILSGSTDPRNPAGHSITPEPKNPAKKQTETATGVSNVLI